jgi:hypothetical protein
MFAHVYIPEPRVICAEGHGLLLALILCYLWLRFGDSLVCDSLLG